MSPDVRKSITVASGWTRPRTITQGLMLAVFLLICLGTAVLGATWTSLSVGDWYAALRKPMWSPPNWVFGPVWTILYIAMAVAAWLVWRMPGTGRWPALLLFGVQLVLNAAWSALFFGLRNPGLAFADIVLLLFAILVTVVRFGRLSAWAAVLMLPYLAWVSFATALNGAIWRLNS